MLRLLGEEGAEKNFSGVRRVEDGDQQESVSTHSEADIVTTIRIRRPSFFVRMKLY